MPINNRSFWGIAKFDTERAPFQLAIRTHRVAHTVMIQASPIANSKYLLIKNEQFAENTS
jgi:hypothetical protein